jgi:uncharacterized protein (TIGR03435 family)
MKLRLVTMLAAAAVTLFRAAPLASQDIAFEVATVKPASGNPHLSNYPRLHNGTLAAENVSLKTLLSAAFGLSSNRIDGPEWIDVEKFDLTGKAPHDVPDTELMPMLKALLQERFKIAVHREQKEMATFDMVIAKSGLKLKLFDPAKPMVPPPHNNGGALYIGAATMSQLADGIGSIVGRPVVDRTGIAGRYSFLLQYASPSRSATETAEVSNLPDVLTAIPEQLGLKLEAKKQQMEILVLDSALHVPIAN